MCLTSCTAPGVMLSLSFASLLSHDHNGDRTWAAWYDAELLIKLTPKGVILSFLFLSKGDRTAA